MTTPAATTSGTPRGIAMRTPGATFLRTVLRLDALATGLTGAMLLAGGGVLDEWFGLSSALLWPVGAFFIVYAAAVWWVSARHQVGRGVVWGVVAVNTLWALDSVVLLFTDWIAPTGLGMAFVIFQAVVVGVFAELQYIGLRRQ